MSNCGGQCENEIPTSATFSEENPPQPFSFDGNVFTIDTSNLPAYVPAAGIVLTDPTTGLATPCDLFLKPGSVINLMIVTGGGSLPPFATVVARGGVIDGVLQSFTAKIPPLPTSGNVYPTPIVYDPAPFNIKGIVIDDIYPDTTGLLVGSSVSGDGIPAGTTVTSIIDTKRILISKQPTVTAPINESLTFTLPTPVSETGTLYFSPCLIYGDIPYVYRRCAGNAPFAYDGLANAALCWEDVTQFFSGAISVAWTIDNTTTTSASSSSSVTDGSGNNTASTYSQSSTATISGSGRQVFSGDTLISIDPSTYTGPGTYVAPAAGKYKVYKCASCCQNCFYVFVIDTSLVTPGTADVTGTYSDSAESIYTPVCLQWDDEHLGH